MAVRHQPSAQSHVSPIDKSHTATGVEGAVPSDAQHPTISSLQSGAFQCLGVQTLVLLKAAIGTAMQDWSGHTLAANPTHLASPDTQVYD